MTPLLAMPTAAPQDVPGAVHGCSSSGLLLAAQVTSGTRSLLVIRYLAGAWRTHPVGAVVFDTAAAPGADTDALRYERLRADSIDGWWHVLDLGGTGTLGEVVLIPCEFRTG